jgi:two-component system CheB/CheR fusion protein
MRAKSPLSNNSKSEGISKIPVVGIGASAGGLSAFKSFFEAIPSDTGMAFVLIQHLDPTHESLMVDLLSKHTKMTVVQVEDKMQIEANHVYMIPPNWSLAVESSVLRLTQPTLRRGMRMPIDFFFNSLAEDQQEQAICIILSGTGSDGTVGLKSVKSYGGMVMAQSPEEAQYDGMPRSAIHTGVVDYALPIAQMVEVLLNYIKHSYVRGRFGTEPVEPFEPDHFNDVISIMHAQLGHSFLHYKKNTLIRRIKRRMGLKQLEHMDDYVHYLRKSPEETNELFKDMLIGVTKFFREPDSWNYLDQRVLGPQLERKGFEDTVRIWVPGCSSGEEAYTIAMLLHERLDAMGKRPLFNIFATDIDTNALEFARTGRYTESVASDIPEQLLNKYFKKEDGFYQVTNHLRENIVFSAQNLISDPPFSKLDLITCRNLLIYLEADIQAKVIELFHFSLNKGGHLMLGNSETIGHNEDLFRSVSKKLRIYERLTSSVPVRANFPIVPDKRGWNRQMYTDQQDRGKTNIKPGEIIQKALLLKYAPASVLVNRAHEILYHYGETTNYLQFGDGEHTNDLFVLVRQGMSTRMRGAFHKALRDDEAVSVTGSRVKRSDKYYRVNFTVTPISTVDNATQGLYLVCFEDSQTIQAQSTEVQVSVEDESVLKQLEHELYSTREELQNTIEELETSNEELKASNEETMSMNEELQSTNEELETSKEELQSLNEELNTVNNELQDKVHLLEETSNDVTNLVNSTDIAALFLGTNFHIKFYTPSAKKLFNLIATDFNRPIEHITARFDNKGLLEKAGQVLNTLKVSLTEVKSEDHEWFFQKILPYRTQDGRIEGVVITFENITQFVISRERYKSLFEGINHGVAIYKAVDDGKDFVFLDMNPGGEKIGKVKKSEILGRTITEVFPEIEPMGLLETFRAVWTTGKAQLHPVSYYHDDRLESWIENFVYKLDSGEIVATYRDVTEQMRAEQKLIEAHEKYQRLIDNSPAISYIFNVNSGSAYWSKNIESILGLKKDDAIKKPFLWLEAIHTEDRPLVDKAIKAAVKKLAPFDIQYRIRNADQDWLWFRDQSIAVKREDGEVIIEGLAIDITSEKQRQLYLATRNNEKSKILNMLQEQIVYVDTKYRIKWLNDAAVNCVGKSRDQIIGLTCHEVWCFNDPNCDKCPLTESMQQKKGIENTITDGAGQKWRIKVEPLFDDNGEIEAIVEIRNMIH